MYLLLDDRHHNARRLIQFILGYGSLVVGGFSKVIASVRVALILGDHLKAAIRYHFKTGHREAA
jgi:ABC-type tungstate transport system substrate-binding protein